MILSGGFTSIPDFVGYVGLGCRLRSSSAFSDIGAPMSGHLIWKRYLLFSIDKMVLCW
jgi:hypothetical protein